MYLHVIMHHIFFNKIACTIASCIEILKKVSYMFVNVNLLLSCVLFYRHSLLDAKINNVLSLCHDQAILNAVQSIIQNMIACEDPSQQQLSYLQSEYKKVKLQCTWQQLERGH